jgi:hypothetical protein
MRRAVTLLAIAIPASAIGVGCARLGAHTGGLDGLALIDVTQRDRHYVAEALVPGDRGEAEANVRRMQAILSQAPARARLFFPAGDYFLHGSPAPNRASVESTASGQVFYGEAPLVSRLVQTDPRRDFGFQAQESWERKHVPCATLRIRHRGCAVRGIGVAIDSEITSPSVLPTAAIQVANIRYLANDNSAIVMSVGVDDELLLDKVLIQDVQVGDHAGPGIASERFFDVGIDIVGSGGGVRASRIPRLDARVGVRLDDGGYCNLGEYRFDDLHMVGRPGVTDEGCFFDWESGLRPMISGCSMRFTNGMRIHSSMTDGSRMEANPEGEVLRRPGKSWDWITVRGWPVEDEPDLTQRRQAKGLALEVFRIFRIGSTPRVGGVEWREGEDFRTEQRGGPATHPYFTATRIHWLKPDSPRAPKPGSLYYVTYRNPYGYHRRNLRGGCFRNCTVIDPERADREGYVLRFDMGEHCGGGGPDFRDGSVGNGFVVANNFATNGLVGFAGKFEDVSLQGNAFAGGWLSLSGLDYTKPARRFHISGNRLNNVSVSGNTEDLVFCDNELKGFFRITAGGGGGPVRRLRFQGNRIGTDAPQECDPPQAVSMYGKVTDALISGNQIRAPRAEGLVLEGVRDAIVSNNSIVDCAKAGLRCKDCAFVQIDGNSLTRNARGLVIEASGDKLGPHLVRGNVLRKNRDGNFVLEAPESCDWSKLLLEGNLGAEK